MHSDLALAAVIDRRVPNDGDTNYTYDALVCAMTAEYAVASHTLCQGHWRKQFREGKTPTSLVEALQTALPDLFLLRETLGFRDEVYCAKDAAIRLRGGDDNGDGDTRFWLWLSCRSDRREAVLAALAACCEDVKEEEESEIDPTVYVLVASMNGVHVQSLGVSVLPLTRANYTDTALRQVDRVIAEFNSATPAGRLVVFSGPPGCGKTSLIKGLTALLMHTTFVYIPSNSVKDLAGTHLLPALMNLAQGHGGSITLVLEDADEVLKERTAETLGGLSTLLNLSDGILGELLDLRIIATTNVEHDKLDPAVFRSGRLLERINVPPLPWQHAQTLFNALTGKSSASYPEEMWRAPACYTLAEVYETARKHGWSPPPKA